MNKRQAAVLTVAVIVIAGAISFHLLKTNDDNSALNADPVATQLPQDQISSYEEGDANLEVLEINSANAPMNVGDTREAGIKSGSKFGYIMSMTSTGDKTTIVFDEAKMLSGEEGERISRVENGCSKPNPSSECGVDNGFMPNGYWISNSSKSTISYTVSTDAVARIIDVSDPNIGVGIRKITVENLKNLISETEMANSPFWVSFKAGKIIDIEQQYLP